MPSDEKPNDPLRTTGASQIQDKLDKILPLLNSGQLKEAISQLQMLTRWGAPHAGVLYNLGLALSQAGKPQEAVMRLKKCIELEPDHVNAWVGLGVAYGRLEKESEAQEAFRHALLSDADNPYANRNLAGLLISSGKLDEAEPHLLNAQKKLPMDPQVILGLGMLSEARAQITDDTNGFKRAELYYKEVISLAPESDAAQGAKKCMTDMAERAFVRRSGGLLGMRPDVMMYILGALGRFGKMSITEGQKLTLEVALLGQKGLEINNPDRRYKIKSIASEDFSGLHVLCIMYTGLRAMGGSFDDTGMKFSAEYDAAAALYKKPEQPQ